MRLTSRCRLQGICIEYDDPLLAELMEHDAHVIAFWRLVVVMLMMGFVGLDAWVWVGVGWQPSVLLAALAGAPSLVAWRYA